jgi:predicted O-methyltransferase YrrM
MKQWHEIHGWFSAEDAKAYSYLCMMMPNKARFLEIGAYKGRSTVLMDTLAKELDKNITIDVIDCFEGDEHIGTDDTYTEFLHNTQDCRIGRVYKEYSDNAYKSLQGKYDAIFIDACHTTEAVLQDITNYTPFLTENGVIAGHDIHFYGVADAVNRITAGNYFVIGNCWIRR